MKFKRMNRCGKGKLMFRVGRQEVLVGVEEERSGEVLDGGGTGCE